MRVKFRSPGASPYSTVHPTHTLPMSPQTSAFVKTRTQQLAHDIYPTVRGLPSPDAKVAYTKRHPLSKEEGLFLVAPALPLDD